MADELNIAKIPGDFGGKEVMEEEMKVLHSAAAKYGFVIRETFYPHGGEHYVATGELLPDTVLEELKQHDAIAFGAVGHPDLTKGEVERGVLLKIRFGLEQYVGLRPSKLYAGVDAPVRKIHPDLEDDYEIVVVRENTGGLYKGLGDVEKDASGRVVHAWQIMDYTRPEVERIVRYAFETAREKGGEKPWPVVLGFKSNVLDYVSAQLWQPVFEEIAATEYADVPSSYAHIDALNGPKLISTIPKDSWVMVTGNMFGDVITDLTSSLFGGMGVGASACINPKGVSMFEPVHGSAYDNSGKGLLSPIAAIFSGAIMLRHVGKTAAADGIEKAVERVLAAGKIPDLTADSGVQTRFVLEELMAA